MKFAIICGSHRENSESLKVSHYIEKTLKKIFQGANVYILGMAGNPLPFWDEGVWNKDPKWDKIWGPISKELQEADALVIVSPEWHGMAPSALKNFFLLCPNNELKHKPGLLVAVSSSYGGSYPIAELRMSSYKNSGICYLPEHIIVRFAKTMLNDGEPDSEDDKYIRKRIEYALRLLEKYAIGLKGVRDSGVVDLKTYPNGM